jgi:hypothetical protein
MSTAGRRFPVPVCSPNGPVSIPTTGKSFVSIARHCHADSRNGSGFVPEPSSFYTCFLMCHAIDVWAPSSSYQSIGRRTFLDALVDQHMSVCHRVYHFVGVYTYIAVFVDIGEYFLTMTLSISLYISSHESNDRLVSVTWRMCASTFAWLRAHVFTP